MRGTWGGDRSLYRSTNDQTPVTSSNGQFVPHQHQDRAEWDDEVLPFFESDLDRRFAEEDGVVSDLRLHRPAAGFAPVFPRLVIGDDVADRIAGAGGDDEAALDLLRIDRGRGEVEA